MWYNKYIGLPYLANGRTTAGIDCWGLAVLVYREELGIELPSFVDDYFGDTKSGITELVAATKEGWNCTETPKLGDICVFNILGEPTHIGIYIGDRKFLHAREGYDSVIESLDSHAWNRRLEGIYNYVEKSVQLTGTPHPLKSQLVSTEWQIPGNTIQNTVEYITSKYNVTNKLLDRTIITLDGIPVPRDLWATTKITAGQTVNYRVMAGRGGTGRMIMMLALLYVSYQLGGAFGAKLAEASTGTAFAMSTATATAIIVGATQVAGTFLINAIAPVTQPKDPGQVAGLNLFNGSSNQANRFGSIPVVLGKVRMAAMLGAQPYIETKTDTSIINLLLVWGFGPLHVSDYQVGLTPIAEYYANNAKDSGVNQQVPTTVYGYAQEDQTALNNVYGRDVTQIVAQRELDNPGGNTVTWAEYALTDECEKIELAFNFPIGMRAVKTDKKNPGQIAESYAKVEVQYKLTSAGSWTTAAFSVPASSGTALTLEDPVYSIGSIQESGSDESYTRQQIYSIPTSYYRWYTIALGIGNQIQVFGGSPVTTQNGEPDPSIVANLYNSSLSSLVNVTSIYSRLPVVPQGFIPIWNICLRGGIGIVQQTDVRPAGQYTGLSLSTSAYNNSKSIKATVSTGTVTGTSSGYTVSQETDILTSKVGGGLVAQSGQTIVVPTTGDWCPFLQEYAAWATVGGTALTTWTHSQTLTIAESGTYKIYMSADNTAKLYISGSGLTLAVTITTGTGINQVTSIVTGGTGYTVGEVVNISGSSNSILATYRIDSVSSAGVVLAGTLIYSGSGYTAGTKATSANPIMELDSAYSYLNVFTKEVYLTAGTKTLTLIANDDTSITDYGVGLRITYTKSGYTPAATTELEWGITNFAQRKDAFNDTYTIWNLPKGRYSVRVRRLDNSNEDRMVEWQQFNKVVLLTVTGYGNPDSSPVTINPKDCYLAKTAIRLQSTNKVNGTIDGVNALVATRCYDWNGTTWVADTISNNPASLFRYVLTHPANMYAIAEDANIGNYIDLAQLQTWHEFCIRKGFTYNNVLTSVKSVMDVLREICAAGLASPTMVNGKWSVVIDAPRTTVTQYFTPHNSWGFESTKSLPKIPDAFRITIPDETQAYQPYEILVYNSTKTADTAKIYEEIQLPGVTNQAQAERLAKWHYAQLKLRPEVYTLNVDFEYLVCTRGDLVRVAHDVPLWGTGTGRVKNITASTVNSITTTNINLTEEVYLQTGKTYIIRLRTLKNTSFTYTLIAVTASNYYSTVSITGSISSDVVADSLYMIGELSGGTQKDSQELIVLSIEPTGNTTAKLTLVDYSPSIYDEDFTNLVYNPNTTGSNSPVVLNTITSAPKIVGFNSDSGLAQEISKGVYINTLFISISNDTDNVVPIAQTLQLQIVDSEAAFPDNSLSLIIADKSAGGFELKGLKSYAGYKFRIRYANATGTISGPWSDIKYITIEGKVTNNLTTPVITVSLDDHYLIVSPDDTSVSQEDQFGAFEYRVYKDTGTGDFWNSVAVTDSNLNFVQSRSAGRIDLLDFSSPRISETGIQYRIACRVLDKNNNYSSTSTLGYFTLKTIVEEDPED